MSIIDDRKEAIRNEYGFFGSPQELFEYIILKNKMAEPLAKELKTEDNLVKGCVSSLWLATNFQDGKCHFKSDADSVITRGIAELVCSMYDGLTPQEVLDFDPAFLEELGINAHLTPNRRNGLSQLCKKIADFAKNYI
ncbi:MAG: SufE family protein [Opitutales bacterium]|nr:SufE family protein [Opitutales bacterium]MBQ2722892.1 SufE family protein [Opitutales bacterium]